MKRLFIRKHYEFNIPLRAMQEKARKEGGLYCYRYENKEKFYNEYLPQVLEDGEEVEIVVFEGEVVGLCPEDVKAYPTRIVKREKYIYHKPTRFSYRDWLYGKTGA